MPATAEEFHLLTHLTELVLCCNPAGTIQYANPAAQRWSDIPLDSHLFTALLSAESSQKGVAFLAAAAQASLATPTEPWELTLRHGDGYTIVAFRGYAHAGQIMIVGQVEPEQVSGMQRELLALNSELIDTQRAQRRQNQQLTQALEAQRRLLETIQELTAPAAPIWKGALLLPLVGTIDSLRAARVTEQLLAAVSQHQARYVILDVSGLAAIDTAVAQHLISAAQAVRLLGAQPVLVGIGPEIAQTLVGLGVQLSGFKTLSSLQHAVAYVLHHLGGGNP